VPMSPAHGFREAVQSVWFIQLLLQIESNGHSVSYGRLDQYLHRFYETDLRNGDITEEEGCELLENLWIKTYSINKIRSWAQTRTTAGNPLYQNVTIGGQRPDGKDAANSLSLLVIRSVGRTRLPQPNLTVRYHRNMTDEFMMRCIEIVKLGTGMPAFNNDEIIVPSFIRAIRLFARQTVTVDNCKEHLLLDVARCRQIQPAQSLAHLQSYAGQSPLQYSSKVNGYVSVTRGVAAFCTDNPDIIQQPAVRGHDGQPLVLQGLALPPGADLQQLLSVLFADMKDVAWTCLEFVDLLHDKVHVIFGKNRCGSEPGRLVAEDEIPISDIYGHLLQDFTVCQGTLQYDRLVLVRLPGIGEDPCSFDAHGRRHGKDAISHLPCSLPGLTDDLCPGVEGAPRPQPTCDSHPT
jgi:hypothetical protein